MGTKVSALFVSYQKTPFLSQSQLLFLAANKLFNMVDRPKRRGRPRKYVDYGVFCQDDQSAASTSSTSNFSAGIKVAVGANNAKAFVPFPVNSQAVLGNLYGKKQA
jgi:hypothetical protein